MIDFGKNAASIWAAYGTALGLYALMIAISWTRSRKAKRDLAALEAKRNG